jgi:hypothetical protein
MGESQSAEWSAEEVSRACGTNEGEAECLRGVEIATRYDLDRPYNGALSDGAELKEIERSEHQGCVHSLPTGSFFQQRLPVCRNNATGQLDSDRTGSPKRRPS